MSSVRLRKLPVPTCFNQMSNSPAASDMKATNLPSGEISAASSAPPIGETGEVCGSQGRFHRRPRSRLPHGEPAASATSAAQGNHVVRVFAEHRSVRFRGYPWQHIVDAINLDLMSPMSLRRVLILGSVRAQQPANWRRRRGRKRRPVRLALENLAIVSEAVSPRKAAAGQHFVQHAAEGPDVGPLVDRLAARLLGAHVGGRAENHAVARAADRVWAMRHDPASTSAGAPWPGRSRAP